MKTTTILAGIAVVAGISACAVNEMPEASEGAMLFTENCAMCHGGDARGGGELAAGMKPVPSDLTRMSARNKGVFPVSHALSAIDGYTRMQFNGQEMPEFGLLLEGPSVPVDTGDGNMTPTPRPLAALMVYLQSIQR
jgi:mono/diheme cytochrome c family protein